MTTPVLLAAPGVSSLTQVQYNTLAAWGVGGIVLSTQWPFVFGGSNPFDSGASNTQQNALAAAAVLAHNAGIKCYLGIYLQNFFWGTPGNTNPGVLLGSWDPSFTDAKGHGWGDQVTANTWFKMCFDYGAAVAQMNVDGMFWDTEGGGMGWGSGGGAPSYLSTGHTANTITISTGNASALSLAAGGGTISVTGTGITAPVTVSGLNTGTGVITLVAGSGGAIGTLSSSASYTFSWPSSTDFMTWQWKNYTNGFGASSSQAQQNGWAQTAGSSMMAAINAGFQSLGGNSVIVGNNVPVYTYQSASDTIGFPLFQNGYLDVFNTFQGNTTGGLPYHTVIGTSTWLSFVTGVASQTTAPFVMGDSTFYGYQRVTTGGPFSGDADGGWARALASNRDSLAGMGLPSNIMITPFLWVYDATTLNGGAGIWPQTNWDQAKRPIWTGTQGNFYMIFQFTNLLSGSTLVTNYANNTSTGGSNQNYTPLNGTAGTAAIIPVFLRP